MGLTEAEAAAELVRIGALDWVSLHDVVSVSLGDGPALWGPDGQPIPPAKSRVLRMLDTLYRDGLMVPGALGDSGFEDWAGTAADWLARSAAELDRLGWRPMGDGHWLRLA